MSGSRPVSARAIPVRARVAAAAEPPRDRLFDPLTRDLVAGQGLAAERFPTLWRDTAALKKLAERKLGALPEKLVDDLTEQHRRLGASAASLASLDRLARGEAVAAIAGQQPAPLGGPLYSLHKTAATVGLAAEFERRTGIPCVPVFWMHGEDSDFAEIRGATLADAGLTLRDLSLPDEVHRDGGLVGDLPLGALRALEAEALEAWAGLAGANDAASLLERAARGARDLGEAYSALKLALFGECGLVVVDPRLPGFRAAARGVIDRYLARADELSAAARAAGDLLEEGGARRALNDAALESFVFAIHDGTRVKIGAAEARAQSAASRVLSPSVALRPAVQDGVLPTVAMACGSGELAYLAQLREVFEGLGVVPACPVPRFGATWLPPAAIELLEAAGADPWSLVTGADAVVRAVADARVPRVPRETLERAHRAAIDGLEAFAKVSKSVDASLPQMVDSARGKVDYQFQRLVEGLSGKVRHQLERKHPEWLRLRYYLLPGDRLQERRLASLQMVAYRGAGVVDDLVELAAEHARALAEGEHLHYLLET
jgi:bacillithiol biosynthesis cysteine-adding enzyme BshC